MGRESPLESRPINPINRESDMAHESPEYVQFFLDSLEPMESFSVIFQKQDGSQRCIVGALDPNGTTRKTTIPVMSDCGAWKSFSIERVLWIGYPDQFESINQSNAESV